MGQDCGGNLYERPSTSKSRKCLRRGKASSIRIVRFGYYPVRKCQRRAAGVTFANLEAERRNLRHIQAVVVAKKTAAPQAAVRALVRLMFLAPLIEHDGQDDNDAFSDILPKR
jgi:hypothetical protein